MKFGIAIENLHLQTIIGILPFERENAQEIAVDLEAVYEVDCHDLPKASLAMTSGDDSRESIINYAILREIILDSFKQNEFFYLESALVAIQGAILKRFPQILELHLSVKKLEIFSDCIPKVRLSWQKGEKLQGLDCFGDFCESPRNDDLMDCHDSTQRAESRNDGNGNTK